MTSIPQLVAGSQSNPPHVHVSEDSFDSWETHALPTTGTGWRHWYSRCNPDGVRLAISSTGTVARTLDGHNWITLDATLPSGVGGGIVNSNAMTYGDGKWAIVSGSGGTAFFSDDDGDSWWEASTPTTTFTRCIAYGGGVWVLGASSTELMRSTDGGVSFQFVTRPSNSTHAHFYGLAYNPVTGTWVAAHYRTPNGIQNGRIIRSTNDGASWVTVFNMDFRYPHSLMYLDGEFWGVGSHNQASPWTFLSDNDGATWTSVRLGSGGNARAMVWDPEESCFWVGAGTNDFYRATKQQMKASYGGVHYGNHFGDNVFDLSHGYAHPRPFPAVQGVSVQARTAHNEVLWTPMSDQHGSASSYDIERQRSDGEGGWTNSRFFSASAPPLLDDVDLDPATLYRYRVRAHR